MPNLVCTFVDLLNLFNDQHGIYSLSAVLKKNGHQVHFVGTRSYKNALRKLESIQPDLVLYSSFSSSISKMIEFDRVLKQKSPIRSIIGGPGVTFDMDSVENSTIDAACVGEGELAIIEYIESNFKSNKNIYNIGGCRPEIYFPYVNLDEQPFPDRDLVYEVDPLMRNNPSKQFLSGRGCPYSCTYCFNHKFRDIFKGCGEFVRKKSVDYLMEEIHQIKNKYGLKNVHLNDDTLILNKKWFFEFCERFPKKFPSLTYSCQVRANLMNEEVAEALANSKCINTTWSIETGNNALRNNVLKRRMDDNDIIRCSKLLRKYKIKFRVANLIGLPGETYNTLNETIELNIKTKPYSSHVNIFIPFPGLELTEYSIKNGFMTPMGSQELPKNFFSKPTLNFSDGMKKKIYKTMSLLPLFVIFPKLFYSERIRKILFLIPGIILRLIVYEPHHLYTHAKWYTSGTSVIQKIRMGIRYFKNW